jgi:hypothetical protein
VTTSLKYLLAVSISHDGSAAGGVVAVLFQWQNLNQKTIDSKRSMTFILPTPLLGTRGKGQNAQNKQQRETNSEG